VGAAKGSLANAVGSMYVRKYFQEDAKQSALEMVHDIRAEFDTMLNEIDWMDDDTRNRAKAKAAGIEEHIGYPAELLDAQKLNDLYAGLELNSTHYLGNALNMTVFGTNYAFSKLREKVRRVVVRVVSNFSLVGGLEQGQLEEKDWTRTRRHYA
jgi:membrane metallo-endopeptidase-like protein 1